MRTNRPIFRSGVLAFLFVITIAYAAPYLHDILRDETRKVPFFSMETGSNRVDITSKEAAQAGIRKRDEVLLINGRPYNGVGDWARPMADTAVGGSITVVLRPSDPASPGQRTVVLPVTARRASLWQTLGDVTLYFVLPAICVLLGFWVAVQRPRDPMAWLLLALMLTLPHIFESYKAEAWPPKWREVAMFYHATLGTMYPVVMFLFGRYFPEPFSTGSFRDKLWKVLQWAIAGPYTIFAMIAAIGAAVDVGSYRSAAVLEHATHPLDGIMQGFGYLLIGSFFAAMAAKYGASRSPDARRRLRILFWGAIAAWTPAVLVLVIYPKIVGKSPAELLPQSVLVTVLALLVLFPLTLAYVIVVHKAMGVGVALRQGLQYALAKNGIRMLQGLAVIVVIASAATLASHESRNRPQKITVIAVGIIAVFTIRQAGERSRAWIDRRFFRETYDAERVLTELSEQVRSIVEPKSLLETVASRVADTLHIARVAVLLGSDAFRPACAVGYGDLSAISFPPSAGVVKLLRRQKEPARVYLENADSWLYLEPDVEDDERSKLSELGSELLLPLVVRDKLLGFISLGPKKSEEPYTGSDVRLLKSVATQTGLALENANLMREIADEVAQRERLNREVEIAREVQERLFPQKLPAIAGLDYAGHCRPALGVGGDYYDFLALPRGQLGVAIGDVSGKGIAAALMMASLQASLRGEATRASENLAAAVSNVNRLVYEASSQERYATFFYGQYDPASHRFDYVNAGHNPPMLFRCSNGRWIVTRLDVGGTVVGLLEAYPYQQGSVTLEAGVVLVAFTDGISEAMNSSDEEWGEQRLIATVEQCAGVSAESVLNDIFAAADTFVAGAKQHDDMTLVVLKVVSGEDYQRQVKADDCGLPLGDS